MVCIALLAPALAAATLATSGSAATHHRSLESPPVLRLEGTRGFKVDIYATEGSDGTPEVSVTIWKPRSEVVYKVPGEVSADRLAASFGHLGFVDVYYRPGPPRTVKDCRGRDRRVTGGRFTGTVEFHGERRITVIDYPNLDVRPLSGYAEICWVGGVAGGHGSTLQAFSRYAETTAIQSQRGGPIRFSAKTGGELDGMNVFFYAEQIGQPNTFASSPKFKWAWLKPPAPFHGTASYRASRAHDKWRGNLTVDFPGYPDYPLTTGPTGAFFELGACKIEASRRPIPPVPCL